MNYENTTVANEKPVVPISAVLDETDGAMSESITILSKILAHVTNESIAFEEKENAQCMKDFAIIMSKKSRMLMEWLARLAQEIGV